jgi:hypothetical protein
MSKSRFSKLAVGATSALLLAGSLGLADPADARTGDVHTSGACTGNARWDLKLAPRDGRIETEFQVDSNVAGQAWTVKIADNGVRVFSGTRTTAAPSGSFAVRTLIANRAGTDHVVATATFNGQTCKGTASL